jgi:Tfp pilus assembly protein PilX
VPRPVERLRRARSNQEGTMLYIILVVLAVVILIGLVTMRRRRTY